MTTAGATRCVRTTPGHITVAASWDSSWLLTVTRVLVSLIMFQTSYRILVFILKVKYNIVRQRRLAASDIRTSLNFICV